jgi:hypothetical protein
VAKIKKRVHGGFEAVCMNSAINISSGPKLLANPTNPVLIVTTGNPPEPCQMAKHLPHCTIENIRERAETMTPLLKKMMEQWPAEHWGLNE